MNLLYIVGSMHKIIMKYLLAAFVLTSCVACKKDDPAPVPATVRYQVSGTNITGLVITYRNPQGTEQSGPVNGASWAQDITVTLPFTASLRAVGTKPSGLVAAPSVTVEILVNGVSRSLVTTPGVVTSANTEIEARTSIAVN